MYYVSGGSVLAGRGADDGETKAGYKYVETGEIRSYCCSSQFALRLDKVTGAANGVGGLVRIVKV